MARINDLITEVQRAVDALGATAVALGYLMISTLAGVVSYIRAIDQAKVNAGIGAHITALFRKGLIAAFVGLLIFLAMRWIGYSDSPLGYLIAGIVCVYAGEALDLAWWALKMRAKAMGVPIKDQDRADMGNDQGDKAQRK